MARYFKIFTKDGVQVIQEVTEDYATSPKDATYSSICDTFVNPNIQFKDGVLTISGKLHKHGFIGVNLGWWEYDPQPVTTIKDGWEKRMNVSEEDTFYKDVTTWKGRWPFKKRTVQHDVLHVKPAWYFYNEGKESKITTSNYRIEYLSSDVQKGIIKG